MQVGILTIGNELTSGKIQDTNSSLIARTFALQGWPVAAMLSVGDDAEAIAGALDFVLARADAVIVTGGLGPTADDITTEAVARAFGVGLYTDEVCLAHIRGHFAAYGLPWTENNAKQARFPVGAQPIVNPAGTAWGFSLRRGNRLVVVIPGVPREVERILPEGVLPRLREAFPEAASHVAVQTIKLFGLPEAAVDAAMADAGLAARGIAVGFYPNFPENHIVLTARESTEEAAWEKLRWAAALVEERLGDHIIARQGETLEGLLAVLLTEKKRTLAVAESCTGGLVTDRLTDVPGSSAYLERGVVTYSNRAKVELLGVSEETLRRHGAVSEPTARAMAEGVRKMAAADVGLSVTGIAGPAGGSAEKPVGTVYVAVTNGERTVCRKYHSRWDRRRTKVIASEWALRILARFLAGKEGA